MSSIIAKNRETAASEERSSTPKRLPEDLFAWEKPLKVCGSRLLTWQLFSLALIQPAKRARVTPTETEPPQSFNGPAFQLSSRRDDSGDVDMHSDSDSDDGQSVRLEDESRANEEGATTKDAKVVQILGADLPSAGDKYGWVEELFVREKTDGDDEEEEFETHIIELDSSDEEAIDELANAASALRI